MGFLRGSGSADGDDKPRDDEPPDEAPRGDARGDDAHGDEALARIEAGGIPLSAERRLQALGKDGALFTSGLSVNEFALLGAVGPRPLAQGMGGCVRSTG